MPHPPPARCPGVTICVAWASSTDALLLTQVCGLHPVALWNSAVVSVGLDECTHHYSITRDSFTALTFPF